MVNKMLITEYKNRVAQAEELLQEKLRRDQDANLVLAEKKDELQAIQDEIIEKSAQLEGVEKPPERMFNVLFDDGTSGIFPEGELKSAESIPKEQFEMLTSLISGDTLPSLDWKLPYQPAKANNKQLADDWRLFVAAIANLDAGKDEPFNYEDIYTWATACLKEIVKRVKAGSMKFSVSEQKSEAYQKLWNAVSKKVNYKPTDNQDLPGIYLVSPHAELIAAGKKSLIVKSRDFSNLCDMELILCSSGLAFGTLKMKAPRKALRAELEELYPAHRITPEEIVEWWPDVKTFYLYDIHDVSIWDKPRHADIPRGVQTFIKNVKLVDSVEREEELSKKVCSTCDLKVCSKECFNAHPGSTIALTKLVNSLNVKARIISNESKVIDDDADQDAEGYMESPSEDKKWLGMIQFDSRKKNVGIDFRWQVSDSTIAAFTVFVPKGLSEVPEDPADAKKILTKEILPLVKETMADPLKKFNCQPKKNISATKDVFKEMVGYGPGYDKKRFMWTVDSFEVEHGCKKLHYVELFCNNDFINGRIVFVKIPNKAEWEKTPEGDYTWMMFKTKTEIPYAISARAVEKKWIPPFGTSALPRKIRDKIPERFQYWKEKDEKKRREVRDELVNEMKKKLIKLNGIKKEKFSNS